MSCDGVHYITDVFRYGKFLASDPRSVIVRDELQPYEVITKFRGCVVYVYAVLDAFGIRVGPGHTEIICTDRGPLLMECAARPHGGPFLRSS